MLPTPRVTAYGKSGTPSTPQAMFIAPYGTIGSSRSTIRYDQMFFFPPGCRSVPLSSSSLGAVLARASAARMEPSGLARPGTTPTSSEKGAEIR